MSHRAIWIVVISLSIFTSNAQADDTCDQPIELAKKFFESSQSFYYKNPPRNLLTEGFYQAVIKEIRCLEANGLCALDYSPWTGAQDGELGKPINYELDSNISGPDRATVRIQYPFILGADHEPEKRSVHIVLEREGHECWRINDLITPLGDSLLGLFSDSDS